MSIFEYAHNAVNEVPLPDLNKDAVSIGTKEVAKAIAGIAADASAIALESWYGVNWPAILPELEQALKSAGVKAEFIHTSTLFRSAEWLEKYRKQFETEDPSFGWVNSEGVMEDVMDQESIALLKERLSKKKGLLLVYGPGASIEALQGLYDARFYFDFILQPMLRQMWGGELVPFGRKDADTNYYWKQYYYCDFYLLYRQKKAAFQRMDYYVDAIHADDLKMLPAQDYNRMIDELVKRPIKQVKIMQPGSYGGYRYKDLWDVPGLKCNAWNEIAGIELSILIDIGCKGNFNIPSQNIMQRPEQLVGEYVHKTFPDLMPLQVWLDDGLFPEEDYPDGVSVERVSMPMHDHPSTQYVNRHFNEPLGRYETYYIAEAYKGATTWMGYRNEADLEDWERRCRESNNQLEIPNWQEYVNRWDTNVGDLFLIPPGTTHGHGGHQMVLEMDTCPSVSGTEYSFFTFEYAKKTWSDQTQDMTGGPARMHLDHSFNNQRWIRKDRVEKFHRARPVVLEGNGRFKKDRYTSIPEMPFHIERIQFEESAINDTEGRFMHMVTLTEGKEILVQSLEDPSLQTKIERFQACIIPAGFGRHEYRNLDGSHAMVVIIRLKNG